MCRKLVSCIAHHIRYSIKDMRYLQQSCNTLEVFGNANNRGCDDLAVSVRACYLQVSVFSVGEADKHGYSAGQSPCQSAIEVRSLASKDREDASK